MAAKMQKLIKKETKFEDIPLDITKKSPIVSEIEEKLRRNIIGQDEAITKIVEGIYCLSSGLKNSEKPILTMMFLGPTGTGKTESVKVLAETLLGNRNAFTRINCQELSESHTVAKLFGSPPGYVGSEIEPLLSQEKLDRFCEEAWVKDKGIFSFNIKNLKNMVSPEDDKNLSIVLFDEIEKAHHSIWTALLSILDDGHIILSNNQTVDMTRSIIIMTSNVGSRELTSKIESNTIGFHIEENTDKDLSSMAIEEMKRLFPPEFCNRFDIIVPFKLLNEEAIKEICYIQFRQLRSEMKKAGIYIDILIHKDVVDFLISKGFNKLYGARELVRTIKMYLTNNISKLISNEEIKNGDTIMTYLEGEDITFSKQVIQ